MKISYTNTLRDMLTFHCYHMWRSPVLLVMTLGCLAFMSSLFFQASAPDPAHHYGLTARVVGTVLFAAALLAILAAVQLAIVVVQLISRHNRTILTGHTLTLGEDGFASETIYAHADYRWHAVQKLRRTPRYLFIYVTQSGAHVIPRRAFHDDADWNAFYDFCQRRIAALPRATGTSTGCTS